MPHNSMVVVSFEISVDGKSEEECAKIILKNRGQCYLCQCKLCLFYNKKTHVCEVSDEKERFKIVKMLLE